ncbi:hypothetical protein WMY93_021796 [Mugilogobius chulae]|uniref:Uncharacterized protein n=1 Tax=Mugilogobius chulae TaxID=88201 RepID=A0AAW0NP66_9GOBI
MCSLKMVPVCQVIALDSCEPDFGFITLWSQSLTGYRDAAPSSKRTTWSIQWATFWWSKICFAEPGLTSIHQLSLQPPSL